MNATKYLTISIAVITLSSCSSSSERIRSMYVGEIPLPSPDKLNLTFTKDDLIVLGEIDISRTFIRSNNERIRTKSLDGVIIKNLGQLSSDVPLIMKGGAQLSGFQLQDNDINELVYDVYTKYPEIDYVVFPKIFAEVNRQSDEMSGSKDSVIARLKGTAVKLKFK